MISRSPLALAVLSLGAFSLSALAQAPSLSTLNPNRFTLAQAQPPAPQVFVHLDSDNPAVELMKVLGTSTGSVWTGKSMGTVVAVHLENTCRTPCDRLVEGGYGTSFMLMGDNVTPSDKFDFAGFRDSVTLKVKAGNNGARVGGVVLVSLGLGAAGAGGLFLAMGNTGPTHPAITNAGSGSSSLGQYALPLLIGGLVATIPGVWLWLSNMTQVHVEQGPPRPPTPGSAPTDMSADAANRAEVVG